MGTSWSVRLVAPAGSDAGAVRDKLLADIQARLDRIIGQMSNWEAASDISRFNLSPPGQWQALPADFLFVLKAGLAVAAASDGAFDPAVGHLVGRWGFGPPAQLGEKQGAAPLPAEPWRAIEVEEGETQEGQVGGRARRLADVALDFSGIAKGFAVDAVSDLLTGQGYGAHLVEIGGELRGRGLKPDGQPWWVDLEVPPGLVLPPTRIALYGLSIATSGDYRRWVQRDGTRISHSMDARAGGPVANGIASVTVLHESAMLADAWATALLVLGLEAGLRLAAEQGLAVLMIRREPQGARDYMSPAFARMLE